MNPATFLEALILCFGDSSSTKNFFLNFMEQSPISIPLKNTVAYRYLILSSGVEDEGRGGWKKAQFNPDLVTGILSWSKTVDGAKYYVKKHTEPSYLILLQGEIIGVDLSEYCQDLIQYYRKSFPSQDAALIENLLQTLEMQLWKYAREAEIVSIEVKSHFILDSYSQD